MKLIHETKSANAKLKNSQMFIKYVLLLLHHRKIAISFKKQFITNTQQKLHGFLNIT